MNDNLYPVALPLSILSGFNIAPPSISHHQRRPKFFLFKYSVDLWSLKHETSSESICTSHFRRWQVYGEALCCVQSTGNPICHTSSTDSLDLPETYTKRQATQHGCLSSLLSDRDKGIEIVNGGEKICCIWPTRAIKAKQNLLYRQDMLNDPTTEGPLSFVHLYSLSYHSSQFRQLITHSPILDKFCYFSPSHWPLPYSMGC